MIAEAIAVCTGGPAPECCRFPTAAERAARINLPTRCPSCGLTWPVPSFGSDWWRWTCDRVAGCGRPFTNGA